MPTEANRNSAAVAGVLVPLVPAVLFYVLLLLCLAEVHVTQYGGGGGEARLSETLTQLWLMVGGVMLWVMLALQLWFIRNAAAVPAWARNAVLPLYLLSAAAAAFAIGAMFQSVGGWSWVVPALLPLLMSLYAAWAGLPLLRRRLAPKIASAVLLGPVALLIVAAVPLAVIDGYDAPRNAARIEARRDAVRESERAELDREIADDKIRYRNLTAASPLADYLHYAGSDDEEDMIARMRLVTSRQSDVPALLKTGAIRRLPLPRLDLGATPELCAAYGDALRKLVDSDVSVPGAWYVNVTDHLEDQIPNMKFLVAGGCNLDDALDAADAPIQFFIAHKPEIEPNLPRWQALLATSAALRHR